MHPGRMVASFCHPFAKAPATKPTLPPARIWTLPTLIGPIGHHGLMGPHAMKAQPLHQGIVVVNDPQIAIRRRNPGHTRMRHTAGQGCSDNSSAKHHPLADNPLMILAHRYDN